MECMLQDWENYETEVVEGLRGPPDTTRRAMWDDLGFDGDIGALFQIIQNTAPRHPLDDPPIVDAILAYHNWTTQQQIHPHAAYIDPCEWHPNGLPAVHVYLHKNTTT